MLKMFLAIGVAIALPACTIERSTQSISTPSPVASPQVKPIKQAPPKDESYRLALDRADSANSISQSAQSREDWQLVVSRWRQAIALLKRVPPKDPNRKLANQKLPEFQKNLSLAQKRADGIGKEKIVTLDSGIRVDAPLSPTEIASVYEKGQQGYRIPIKYRKSRIPVIDVVFNGNQQYEMMVDTGASATMITEAMAQTLQVQIIGSSNAMTAAGLTTVEVAMVKSISVAGNTIRNVPVSIGPLDVGLLGHDFFGDCDISITRDYVELKQCGI